METLSPIPVPPPPTPTPARPQRQRLLLLAGGAAVLLICCCCLAAVGVVVLDPFGWNLLGRLQGGADPLAAAVPADTSLYATLDVAQFRSASLRKLLDAYAEVPGAQDLAKPGQEFETLDKNLQDQFGVTFTDDILPWAGQFVGLAASNVTPGTLGKSSAEVVFLVEVRDRAKAAAFMKKLTAALENQTGTTMTTDDYQGVTLVTVTGGTNPTVLGISKSLLLMGNSLPAIQHVIDGQQGKVDTLPKAAAFKNLLGQLPKARLVTMFMPAEALAQLARQSGSSLGVDVTQSGLNNLQGLALSVAVVDAGVQVDTVMAYDEKALSAAQQGLLRAAGSATGPARLPSGTLAYMIVQHPDMIWANYRDTLNATNPGDFDTAMGQFASQFGFNPDRDLLPYLTGELVLAVVPDADSFLAQTGQGDLGFVVAGQTSDAAALQTALANFNTAAKASGGTEVTVETLAGMDAYSLAISGGKPMAYYGAGQQWLTIASSAAVFSDFYAAGNAVADDPAHQAVWAALPKGEAPVLYVDVQGVLTLAEQAGLTQSTDVQSMLVYLRPIQAVAAGTAPLKNGAVHSTLLLRVDKPQP